MSKRPTRCAGCYKHMGVARFPSLGWLCEMCVDVSDEVYAIANDEILNAVDQVDAVRRVVEHLRKIETREK